MKCNENGMFISTHIWELVMLHSRVTSRKRCCSPEKTVKTKVHSFAWGLEYQASTLAKVVNFTLRFRFHHTSPRTKRPNHTRANWSRLLQNENKTTCVIRISIWVALTVAILPTLLVGQGLCHRKAAIFKAIIATVKGYERIRWYRTQGSVTFASELFLQT